ncbi:MAG TPA: thiolase family protein [Phycisphaerae bacterium]|nr:thiolase family protein [Phycisphaerae bacterium]
MLKNVYIAGGVRTPLGAYLGSLSELSAAQLGAHAVKGALTSAGVKPADVDEVFMGNVIGAGLGQNIARQCSLGAGIGEEVGATTINKVCGSALRAIILAAQGIQCGDINLAVAGGTESMSNAPYLLPKARKGYRMGNGELVDAMIHDGLWDVYNQVHMGTCGDACATEFGFSREEQDDFAIASCQRAIAAWENGFYPQWVLPIDVPSRKETIRVEHDENLARFDEGKVRALRPAFGKEGTVTAGNASGINDGAAACVVMSEERMQSLGIKPQARILGHANVAMAPTKFTNAPIHAIRKLADQLNLKLADVDLFEINEAFGVVAMAAMKELSLDHAKVNVHGGAVALGHPIGSTGAWITISLAHALRARKGKVGIACLCIGGGEASAIAIESCG